MTYLHVNRWDMLGNCWDISENREKTNAPQLFKNDIRRDPYMTHICIYPHPRQNEECDRNCIYMVKVLHENKQDVRG